MSVLYGDIMWRYDRTAKSREAEKETTRETELKTETHVQK
jgi:hypothetical protein